MPVRMDCNQARPVPPNQFALVSYIPGLLGRFLDRLRLELVPACSPHAHVTVLPPRSIRASEDVAAREILSEADEFSSFEVALGEVEIFPVSKVIFIGIKCGEEELRKMYRKLNRGAVAFCEQFPYHPHVTLAQNIPPDEVDRLYQLARLRWAEYCDSRCFQVDTLDFVKNIFDNHWIDLANVHLRPAETSLEKPTLVL